MAEMALGLLIIRMIVGVALAAHGAQKLLGWFGGYGITGTAGFMEGLGFRPGAMFAVAAGLGELVGGLLVAFGLLGPIGPALVVSTMLVASSVHVKGGFFAQNGGMELPIAYGAVAAGLAFTGFGAFSLDALARLPLLGETRTIWIVLALGVLGGIANLAVRRPAAVAGAGAG